MATAPEPPSRLRSSQGTSPRIEREKRTVEAMLCIYCSAHHASTRGASKYSATEHDRSPGGCVDGGGAGEDRTPDRPRQDLCSSCAELLEYAFCRLERCPFGAEKPTCARCPVHCYKPAFRTMIKAVMRYAGPRMLYRHPVLALLHQIDSFRRRGGPQTIRSRCERSAEERP